MKTQPLAGPREWLGLAVLALPTVLLGMDATVLYLAAPHLNADLAPSGTELLWIVDVYGFMVAGFLVTMGTLGDRIGRRKLLMIGAAAFGAASVLAAYAPNPELMIAARALLGVAGATLGPSTLALISTMFRHPGQRATAIALWAACFSVGIAVGPIAGGLLLEWFWWGAAFLVAAPVMVLLVATAPVLLPEYRDPDAGRLDLTSVALSLATVLPVIYGIKGGSPVAVVIGVAFGVVFVRRQLRLADPLLDLTMFRSRSFSAALLVQLFTLTMIGGVYLFVTQYLQLVEGFSPLVAGLWLLPSAVVLVIASMLVPVVARRVKPAYLVGVSLVITAIGFAMLALVGGLPMLVAGFAIVYLGISPVMALGTDLVIGTAPPEKAGSAAAMAETAMEFGIALGVAVLGVIGTAVATSDGALLDAAPDAFTDGLNVVAGISAVLVLVLAVVAVRLLRGEEPAEHHQSGAAHGGDQVGKGVGQGDDCGEQRLAEQHRP
jgi:DHA2 family multidrug resistance protein-like MFS transporter